jgi:hypothetical protein
MPEIPPIEVEVQSDNIFVLGLKFIEGPLAITYLRGFKAAYCTGPHMNGKPREVPIYELSSLAREEDILEVGDTQAAYEESGRGAKPLTPKKLRGLLQDAIKTALFAKGLPDIGDLDDWPLRDASEGLLMAPRRCNRPKHLGGPQDDSIWHWAHRVCPGGGRIQFPDHCNIWASVEYDSTIPKISTTGAFLAAQFRPTSHPEGKRWESRSLVSKMVKYKILDEPKKIREGPITLNTWTFTPDFMEYLATVSPGDIEAKCSDTGNQAEQILDHKSL